MLVRRDFLLPGRLGREPVVAECCGDCAGFESRHGPRASAKFLGRTASEPPGFHPVPGPVLVTTSTCWLALASALQPLQGVPEKLDLASLEPKTWSVLDARRTGSTGPFDPDPVRHAIFGSRSPGVEDGFISWQQQDTDASGQVCGPLSYAATTVLAESEAVVFIRAAGAAVLFVNGEPLMGDPLHREGLGVPVLLRQGGNTILVSGVESAFRVHFRWPPGRLVIPEWGVRAPGVTPEFDSWFFKDAFFPIVNASTVRTDYLHLHYGPVVLPHEEPVITDWMDGPLRIEPLAMAERSTYVSARDRVGRAGWSEAYLPVQVYEFETGGDRSGSDVRRAPRTLLRIPLPDRRHDEAASLRRDVWDRPGLSSQLASSPIALIYGTGGGLEVTRELLARARFDQQVIWYYGGYAPPLLSDLQAAAGHLGGGRAPLRDHDLVLYGNWDTNRCYSLVLDGSCPVQVENGTVAVGARRFERPDLAVWFVWERADVEGAGKVICLGDTWRAGSRVGGALSPFWPGQQLEEYSVFAADFLASGPDAVLASGSILDLAR
ncbi:MAG: hypothetical protein ACI8QZ_001851 [Chlamydiales bacterium]|jgi:hypothetical protein